MATSTIKFNNHSRTNLLAWGTYGDGTYDLATSAIQYDMICVLVGDNGRYSTMRPMGVANDTIAIPTGTGDVLITFNTMSNITVSGTGTGKQLRQIIMYPSIKLA